MYAILIAISYKQEKSIKLVFKIIWPMSFNQKQLPVVVLDFVTIVYFLITIKISQLSRNELRETPKKFLFQ